MPLQNFVDKVGPVVSAAWLNMVDALSTTVFKNANTNSGARTALFLDAPLEVTNGGTGQRTAAAAALQLGVYASTQTVASSGTIGVTETYVSVPLLLPANSLKAGSTIQITSFGGSTNTSGTNSILENVRIGPSGTLSDPLTNIQANETFTGATGPNFMCVHHLHFRSVGVAGKVLHEYEWQTNGGSNQNIGIDATAGLTVNTTVDLYIGMTAQTSNAALTINYLSSLVQRIL